MWEAFNGLERASTVRNRLRLTVWCPASASSWSPPATGGLAFYRALRTASGKTVAPYDLGRTYAQWLDLARIPQFRQDYYMAHGPKDPTPCTSGCGR